MGADGCVARYVSAGPPGAERQAGPCRRRAKRALDPIEADSAAMRCWNLGLNPGYAETASSIARRAWAYGRQAHGA